MQIQPDVLIAFVILTIYITASSIITYRARHRRTIKIRDALLTHEDLEKHAKEIAMDHNISEKPNFHGWPIHRMNENYKFIFNVYKSLTEDAQKSRNTSPAAEWLLDNFYIIEEQVKIVRKNLTKKFYSRLPALTRGPLKGYARIHVIALELISHSDGRVDEKILTDYIRAYQSHSTLSDREIWALAIMIRLAIIENIRYICEKTMETHQQWRKADEVLSGFSKADGREYQKSFQTIESNIKNTFEINTSFIEYLSYRLRRMGKMSSHILQFIDETLAQYNMTIDTITQKEHNIQAARKVSIENCIVSLKFLSNLDWIDIFENISQVEQVLREDPDGTYPKMDFSSRSYYRSKVEELAKLFNVSEVHIAKEALKLARNAEVENDTDERFRHVGFYLVSKGVEILEEKLGYQPSLIQRIYRSLIKHPEFLYPGSIISVTMLLTAFTARYAYLCAQPEYKVLFTVLAAIVSIIPASDIATCSVNWLFSHIFKPSILPKLELKDGIPDDNSTMVVIPALIPDEKSAKELLERLEIHYLANEDKNLYFALSGDFKDSTEENEPGDENIINTALSIVRKLNQKYAKDGNDIFYFFHRHRQFNERQNKWMGWERKRGALVEFNDLLLGSSETSYSTLSCDLSSIPQVKYIITLDADTILPLEAAKKLVGTMSHPLNKPLVDEQRGIVVDGYGLLQPRIGVEIESANKSLFSRIFAGECGIDPYSCAVSDIYQDLFGEGIYTGKGIYELRVFQKLLKPAIPDNAVLSHDLLEGSYVRTGLVSDVELIDGYPSRYNSYAMRMHRWIRGDWQLIPWLFPKVRDKFGNFRMNPLSLISRWKILDNMRRSIVYPALMILIASGFSFLPGSSIFWLGFSILPIAFPLISGLIDYAWSKRHGNYIQKHYIPVIYGVKATLYKVLLLFTFLPYQAYLSANAICVTLIRVFITKRNMLEWVTASDVEKKLKNNIKSFWIKMRISMFEALIIVGLAWIFRQDQIIPSLILFIMWSASPFVAYRISKTYEQAQTQFTFNDIMELRTYARKTWRYFEEFVNARNSFLPPDNYQEDPPNGIAYRTSPTNIGLALLSTLSARDLGYIGTRSMFERISSTVCSMEKMERWKGHLYNWYDTRNLRPLKPRYVSTVDSGNFITYLITLIQGMNEYLNRPLIEPVFSDGLKDTIRILRSDTAENYNDSALLDEFAKNANDMTLFTSALEELSSSNRDFDMRKSRWKIKIDKMIDSFREEIIDFLPWSGMLKELSDIQKSHPQLAGTAEKLKALPLSAALIDLPSAIKEIAGDIFEIISNDNSVKVSFLNDLHTVLLKSAQNIEAFIKKYTEIMERIDDFCKSTDFAPLYDNKKQLFSIGYNIEDNRLTNSYYDLLASEARQSSFIAIAKGDVPPKHWYKLSRTLTVIDHYKGLISWSGTMFEYLMPLLTMKSYKNTLIDETYWFAVNSQKKYGRQMNVPWGVSESAFYSLDINLDYQYKAFGVPWLGLKRGLVEDVVIAPYATMLALMVDPAGSIENLRRLKKEGLDGPYGFYEAVDYTPERIPFDKKNAVIKSFMSHHQGMSLLALNNVLNSNIMQERFHNDPLIKAAQLLLQEKVPANILFTKENKEKIMPFKSAAYAEGDSIRKYDSIDPVLPRAHILSNGDYSVMITDRGTGYSRNRAFAVTRWREDVSVDNYGTFIYIRNIDTGTVWSSAYAPYNTVPERYSVTFTSDRAKFIRRDGDIETKTEVVVSPGDNIEIRQVSLTNKGQSPQVLEVTSYFETVLTSQNSDLAHPAFSNLFIRTEFVHDLDTLLANRKPRAESDNPVWAFNTMVVEGETVGRIEYETDRMQFIGRGRTVANPYAMEPNKPLSNTVGAVLDPIMSMRRMVKIDPGQTARISYVTGIGDCREDVLELAEKFSTPEAIIRTFRLALTRSRVEAKYLNLKSSETELYQEIISHILFLSPLHTTHGCANTADKSSESRRGQSFLWPYGISGDLPIVLVILKEQDEVDIVYEILKAHEYWRIKDLRVDLVILNEESVSYTTPLHTLLGDIVSASHAHDVVNKPGGVFILKGMNMPEEDKNLICAAARLVLRGNGNSLAEQVQLPPERQLPAYKHFNTAGQDDSSSMPLKLENEQLEFFNGIGGFNSDGTEYVIRLEKGQYTPMPWVNIISNPQFGFIATESGSGYTWYENSRENKITPWSNDPVSDVPGEVLYLRDNSTGMIWTPTPLPVRESEPYLVRHGFGYSVFEHVSHGLEQELTQFVPVNDPVKISILRLKNDSDTPKDISLTYYMRPVLGVNSQLTAQHIISRSSESGTILLENTYTEEFPGRTAFIDVSEDARSITGDRREFIGKGNIAEPEALKRECLSGAVGVGYDPCAALQTNISLNPNEEKEVVFLLGACKDPQEINSVTEKYRDIENAKRALQEAKGYWQGILQTIHVNTPDPATNFMLNGWLVYQIISCRLWARSAFYQSGGAYGFRDQLQDVMSIAQVWPEVVRNQILYHSSHQFQEGDVQHWWHEPQSKGTRTKSSDDLLWLPYVVSEYIRITGDFKILENQSPFLEGELLKEFQDEIYMKPTVSASSASIFEHCIRAIEKSLNFGIHGIPLIGSGDWNDGMNTIGNKGTGESVWLGWFLYSILTKFVPICESMGDKERAQKYSNIASELVKSIEENAWDGSWYRRAYFDDGTPLGSIQNDECKIDSISQSWAVISGGGSPEKISKAMEALENYLVKRDEGLIKLLTPPFNEGVLEPGYIKGYVPGVRENGGQYTHAAIWVILAFTMLGQGDKSWELFELINPINHSRTQIEYSRYKVEPYVMAADVYAADPHTGRGGWTWYTGSAGWMYKVALENILGFQKNGEKLVINPCIPSRWGSYDIDYRYMSTVYRIRILNPEGVNSGIKKVTVDGRESPDNTIDLVDDKVEHIVEVYMGK